MSAVSTLSGHDQLSSVSSPRFWNIRMRPKSANNAAIQHVIPQLSDGNAVIRRHFENRSDKSLSQCKLIPPLLMVRICLIRPSHQDKNVYGCGGHGEEHVCADGP